VPLAAGEARLEQIVRGQRGKARRQRPLAPDEDPHDCRFQIVVRYPRGHAVDVREGPHVPIQEARLVLPLVDPGEVATRVHQPHQEEPRLPTHRVEIDEHLEEVHLGELARPIRQRDKHLAPLPSPLRHGRLH
jgi:hypothetical protein